jgi:hypothetical protein
MIMFMFNVRPIKCIKVKTANFRMSISHFDKKRESLNH